MHDSLRYSHIHWVLGQFRASKVDNGLVLKASCARSISLNLYVFKASACGCLQLHYQVLISLQNLYSVPVSACHRTSPKWYPTRFKDVARRSYVPDVRCTPRDVTAYELNGRGITFRFSHPPHTRLPRCPLRTYRKTLLAPKPK